MLQHSKNSQNKQLYSHLFITEVAYHSIRGPGMDGGAAAGLGIGMILAGAALAGVGILVYKKKTGHVSIPRQKLTNEKS